MNITIEKNERLGEGFQLHVSTALQNQIMDFDPLDLASAMSIASELVSEYNKRHNANVKREDVIHFDTNSIIANKSKDLMAMKLWKDIDTQSFQYLKPSEEQQEKEILFTGQGIVLMSLMMWIDEENSRAKEILLYYCKLLASKRFGGTYKDVWNVANKITKDEAAEWVHSTYSKYNINDDSVIGFVKGLC